MLEPPHTAPVLHALRNQLQEKDALIRHLEVNWGLRERGRLGGGTTTAHPPPHHHPHCCPPQNDYERSRAQQEREERLLVTAWYNMVRGGGK